jgi:hypothetical protein
MIAIAMAVMVLIGWFGRRAYDHAMMKYQLDEHEKEKKFMWDEIRRLRNWMACNIGNTDRIDVTQFNSVVTGGWDSLVDPGVRKSN